MNCPGSTPTDPHAVASSQDTCGFCAELVSLTIVMGVPLPEAIAAIEQALVRREEHITQVLEQLKRKEP